MKYQNSKNTLSSLGGIVVALVIVYLMVSLTTFRLRHPWATDLEIWLNIHKALTFQKVSYKEMRGIY